MKYLRHVTSFCIIYVGDVVSYQNHEVQSTKGKPFSKFHVQMSCFLSQPIQINVYIHILNLDINLWYYFKCANVESCKISSFSPVA